jgi:endonuclease YncB( thermonuclease family)
VGRTIILAFAVLSLLVAVPAGATTVLSGQASVIDGDTIEIHDQRIRFFGIDAPESHQTCEAAGQTYRCGQQAALALADRIGQQTVSCEKHDVDRYGRIVAVCRAGGEDLNAWMVSQGWALAYRHYSTAYVGQEEAAHAAKLGIWRGPFTAPWDWRRHASADCIRPVGRCGVGNNRSDSVACHNLMLQSLLDQPGLRRCLHQSDENLPQAKGVRVQCAVN